MPPFAILEQLIDPSEEVWFSSPRAKQYAYLHNTNPAHLKKTRQTVDPGTKLTIDVAAGAGFVACITPV